MYFVLHYFYKNYYVYIFQAYLKITFNLHQKTASRFTLQLIGLCIIRHFAERNFRVGCKLSFV